MVEKNSELAGGETIMALLSEILDFQDEMIRWRHDIHQHPDCGIHDLRTSSKIAELLRSFQLDDVIEQYGQVGVVGILRQGQGQTLGLVAGISGQTINEVENNLEYRSVIPKCMHAIGHDGEISILLGVAKYLAKTRQFSGTIVFIFCVREDSGLGAQAMIEEGLLQQFPMNRIYAMTSWPGLPVGDIGLISGPVMASVAELLIKVTGVAGHSGMPNQARSPIFAASEMVNSLGNLVASEVDPGNPISVCINSFHSGDSFSYIPETAEMKASVRFLNPDIEAWLPERIEELINGIADAYHVYAQTSYRKICDVAINDQRAVRFAREIGREILGEDHIKETVSPLMIGYDIANFLREVPGAIIYFGNGKSAPLLSPNYDFDDKMLPIGASFFAQLAIEFVRGKF